MLYCDCVVGCRQDNESGHVLYSGKGDYFNARMVCTNATPMRLSFVLNYVHSYVCMNRRRHYSQLSTYLPQVSDELNVLYLR